MTKSVVTAKLLRPPKVLERFFGAPPLLGSEKLEDYDPFFLAVAAAAKPVDCIGWILVWELTVIWWEIRRERSIKLEIVRLKQLEVAAGTFRMTRADYEREKELARAMAHEDDEPSAFRLKDSLPVERKQEALTVLAKAYLQNGDAIDFIDRRIAVLECRRSALLREVDRRNELVARNADKAAADIVDAEFAESEE